MFKLLIETLQDTEPELTITLDRNDAGVGQMMIRITFKLNPLLEVDQIEFHFIRTAPEGEIAHDDMEESRFARTRLPGYEGMLAGSFSESEILQFRRAAATDRDTKLSRCSERPSFAFFRSDKREGHLDTIRIAIRRTELMDPANKGLRRRRRVKGDGRTFHRIILDQKSILGRAQTKRGLAKIIHLKAHWHLGPLIAMNQKKNPAPRSR